MLTVEQKELLDRLINTLDKKQISWLSGFFAGLVLGDEESGSHQNIHSNLSSSSDSSVHVLFGSRSGNSQSVAKKLTEKFKLSGISVKCNDLNDYATKDLKNERNLVIVVSTHGEGDPPVAAEEFYQFIHSSRISTLKELNFAVCALGDSSYEFFCKTGADIDKRLEELGAKRLIERIDCDLDFDDPSEKWMDAAVKVFAGKLKTFPEFNSKVIENKDVTDSGLGYNKNNPFKAKILEKVLLSGRGSKKENYHIELSIEGSGLKYKPGDALGILPVNSPELVDKLIDLKKFNPETIINNGTGSKSLKDNLLHHYELSTLTKDVMINYSNFFTNEQLTKIINDHTLLREYAYGRDVIDLLTDYPADIEPHDLLGVLRKLQPRLYSIASSQVSYEDEVHLIINTVRYPGKNGSKEGTCSTYLSDRINIDEYLPVFIDSNPNFKLPDDPDVPIIMIGPGTGIAPFRGFIQERQSISARGKNWLFFGDQYFTTDFLYQLEWQKYLKQGILTRMDIAFSQDTLEKVYVQHRMMEHSKELYAWLQEGAHIYVCGDAKRMAPDVFQTLVSITEEQGCLNKDMANDYIKNLRKSRRYHEDVY